MVPGVESGQKKMTEAVEPSASTVMVKPAKTRKAKANQSASDKWRHLEESRAKIRERLIFVNRFEDFHLDRHQKDLKSSEKESLRDIFRTKDNMKLSLIDLAKSRRQYKNNVCDYERKVRKGAMSPVFSKERDRIRQKERDLRDLQSRLQGPNASGVAEHLKDELRMIEYRNSVGSSDFNTTKSLPAIGGDSGASQNIVSFGNTQLLNNGLDEPQQGLFGQGDSGYSNPIQPSTTQTPPLDLHNLDLGHVGQTVELHGITSPRLPNTQIAEAKSQSTEEVSDPSEITPIKGGVDKMTGINTEPLVKTRRTKTNRRPRKIFNTHSPITTASASSESEMEKTIQDLSDNDTRDATLLSPVVEDSDAEDSDADDYDKVKVQTDHHLPGLNGSHSHVVEPDNERLSPINEAQELPQDELIHDPSTSETSDIQPPPKKRSKKIKLRSRMKRKLLKDNETVAVVSAADLEVARQERHAQKRLAQVRKKATKHIDKITKTQGNKTSPRSEVDTSGDSDRVLKTDRVHSSASSGYNPGKRKHSRSFEVRKGSYTGEGGIRLPPIRVDTQLLKELKRQRSIHRKESSGFLKLP